MTGPATTRKDLTVKQLQRILLCAWVLFSMQSMPAGEYLWKPVEQFETSAACQVKAREMTHRGDIAPLGLLGMYADAENPFMRYGCMPEGYNPYDPK